jgi:hypothetical protein
MAAMSDKSKVFLKNHELISMKYIPSDENKVFKKFIFSSFQKRICMTNSA